MPGWRLLLQTGKRYFLPRALAWKVGSVPIFRLTLFPCIASVTKMFVDPASGYGVITLMNTKHTELRLPIPKIVLTQLRNS